MAVLGASGGWHAITCSGVEIRAELAAADSAVPRENVSVDLDELGWACHVVLPSVWSGSCTLEPSTVAANTWPARHPARKEALASIHR